MKPQFAYVRHDPENNLYGDCLRAVIASLLEIEIDTIPHFFEQDVSAAEAWRRLDAYLAKTHSLSTAAMYADGATPIDDVLNMVAASNPNMYYMLFGQSSAGGAHVVIALNDAIVHDPSWLNISVVGPTFYPELNASLWCVGLLIPSILKAPAN